jgi:D-amino-acid dehydrogenase
MREARRLFPAGFDYRVTAAGQAQVLSEALRIALGLGTSTLDETRVGFRPVSPDGRPHLGVIGGDLPQHHALLTAPGTDHV